MILIMIGAIRFIFTAAAMSTAAVLALGQAELPNFNRVSTFDAQHYTIRASFDRSKKSVSGDTTVSVKPLKDNFRELELDAVELAFESVKLEPAGTALQYKTAPGKVIVALDKAYGPTDTVSVRFKYTTKPKKGVYFRDAENGHSYQIWTQGEAEEGRYWFPSFDFPSDKATTEEFITAEKGFTVVGNGELIEKIDGGSTETWHYRMPVPHSTYLVSFVVGKYAKVEDTYKDIPLGYYIYPGREQTARNAYGKTKDMIAVYEQLTGVPFPYNKYDQTVVANFQFGGMENITATTMSDSEILMADTDFGRALVGDLVSHELAHSWFGDLVTCKNWAELWLNEGFATYMEAAYREKAFSREDYIAKVQSDAAQFIIDDEITRKRHGLFNRRAANVDALFDNSSVTYNKGGAVVHMLREQVGTETFWKAINTYLNRHKLGSVESTDLKKAMEEASGQELGWFFDQWVYGASYPRLNVASTYSPSTKTLKITVTQTHKIEPLIPASFRLPMDIEIKTASGTKTEKMDVKKRVQTFSYTIDRKPTAISFDPGNKIVLKSVKQKPTTTLR
jgi:aminopeptidase N